MHSHCSYICIVTSDEFLEKNYYEILCKFWRNENFKCNFQEPEKIFNKNVLENILEDFKETAWARE